LLPPSLWFKDQIATSPPFKHVADETANEYLSSLDLMLPDHDSLMSGNYLEVAKDITKLA
jgi:hypothetical protein